MKKFIIPLIIVILFVMNTNIFSEDINFYTKAGFSDSQFWEKHRTIDSSVEYVDRNVFSNLFSGTIGVGLEMIIWDMTKKRGSRLYFKGGFDLVFAGINYVGAYNDIDGINDNYYRTKTATTDMYSLNGSSVFYMGVDWDIFVGGTFPKTDLIWGFGCVFTFLFPTYSDGYDVSQFYEKYAFYAAPSVLIGYDIFIPNTDFKITPQITTGFTCNSLVPDDIIEDTTVSGEDWALSYLYSGFYINLSVAFSFKSIEWKK